MWQTPYTAHQEESPSCYLESPLLATDFHQLGLISYRLSTCQVSATGGEHSKHERLLGRHSCFKVERFPTYKIFSAMIVQVKGKVLPKAEVPENYRRGPTGNTYGGHRAEGGGWSLSFWDVDNGSLGQKKHTGWSSWVTPILLSCIDLFSKCSMEGQGGLLFCCPSESQGYHTEGICAP